MNNINNITIYCVNCRKEMELMGIESNYHVDENDTNERHYYQCQHCSTDVGRILRTFKIKKNVEVTDNGKIII